MFEETKKGFDWFSLIVGVLFIIAGIASFTRPDKTLHFLAIVAGIAFIFRGIYELWFRQRIGRILGESSGWLIFSAILDIILGIFNQALGYSSLLSSSLSGLSLTLSLS